MNIVKPGNLLIADPFLKDPAFSRKVVFLCEHSPEASFGFILNLQHKNLLSELVEEAGGLPLPVYNGGPVETNTLHFIHNLPKHIPGSYKIMPNVYWGGNFEMAIQYLKENNAAQNKIRFFAGYSGWGQNQLDTELNEKSWIILPEGQSFLFRNNVNQLWKEALKQLGKDYELFLNSPIDPVLN